MAKNIQMNYKGDSGYEVLYPQSTVGNLTDFRGYMSNNYYNKSQVDSKDTTINNRVTQVDNRVTSVNNNLTALISSTANSLIQSPYGMICIRAMDSNGSPVSNQTFTVSPKIGQDKSISSFTTADNGMFVEFAQVGTYTITPNTSIAQAVPSSMQVTVSSNELEYADFQIGFGSSGEIKITSSQNFTFPSSFNYNIDLFLVGGGGGVLSTRADEDTPCAGIGGGGGGYTKTIKNLSASGKNLQIVIGSGGPLAIGGQGDNYTGKNGGATKITGDLGTYEAQGGKGGGWLAGKSVSYNEYISGGDGGSGGGGLYWSYNNHRLGEGGYNGSSGTEQGGTGQGTNTAKFGETTSNNMDIYGAGGKCVYYVYKYGSSQVEYGQSGRKNQDIPEGSGDGGSRNDSEYGSGHSGCVIIRWPSR